MKHAATSVVGIPRAPLSPPSRSLAVSLIGWIGALACAIAIACIALGDARLALASDPVDTLYGAGGSYILTVDQNDGLTTAFANHPGFYFRGLAFDSTGRLFASGCIVACFYWDSEWLLFELDSLTGEILDVIGPVIEDSGADVEMLSLSVQPETDVLFGFSVDTSSYPRSSRIWTIDKSTATATLIAPTVPAGCPSGCSENTAFGFASDGTLYHIYGDRFLGTELMTLDPSTGAELTSVPLTTVPSDRAYDFGSLAVRSDGFIFSYSGPYRFPRQRGQPPPDPPTAPPALSMIDPATAIATELGTRDESSFAFDLDFSGVVESVELDIKPGGDLNSVNPSIDGILPVAILGSDTVDVTDVDGTTLAFGPNGAGLAHFRGPHFEDVDGDGLTDLLGHFRIENAGIQFGDTEACVTGKLLDGTPLKGCDSVRTVPDMDGDELLDIDEEAIGTDALLWDTDGDGFGDGEEVYVMGTDPLDALDPAPASVARGPKGGRRRH